jgi:hypothetical protein
VISSIDALSARVQASLYVWLGTQYFKNKQAMHCGRQRSSRPSERLRQTPADAAG